MNPTEGNSAPGPWPRAHALRGKPSGSMAGFLVVAMVVGYEWFVSDPAKFVRGGFPEGLEDELTEKSVGVPGWYSSLMDATVLRSAEAFGYAIEVSEVLAGVALIAGPFIWLFAWHRVSDRLRMTVLLSMAATAFGGAFLTINLHLANGASHPWLIPEDGFDEGIDLDSVLPAIQIVNAAVSLILFWRLRRAGVDSTASAAVACAGAGY